MSTQQLLFNQTNYDTATHIHTSETLVTVNMQFSNVIIKLGLLFFFIANQG